MQKVENQTKNFVINNIDFSISISYSLFFFSIPLIIIFQLYDFFFLTFFHLCFFLLHTRIPIPRSFSSLVSFYFSISSPPRSPHYLCPLCFYFSTYRQTVAHLWEKASGDQESPEEQSRQSHHATPPRPPPYHQTDQLVFFFFFFSFFYSTLLL